MAWFALLAKIANFAECVFVRRAKPEPDKDKILHDLIKTGREPWPLHHPTPNRKVVMAKILTKHFQYTGTDDFDLTIDVQLNDFIKNEGIVPEDVIDIKYEGHSALGVNTYSALLIYKKA